MADAPEKSQRIELSIPEKALPNPEAANWFQVARVGADYQLLIGYVDLLGIHRYGEIVKSGAQPNKLLVDVTHRFALSRDAIGFLQTQLNEVLRKSEEREAEESADA